MVLALGVWLEWNSGVILDATAGLRCQCHCPHPHAEVLSYVSHSPEPNWLHGLWGDPAFRSRFLIGMQVLLHVTMAPRCFLGASSEAFRANE